MNKSYLRKVSTTLIAAAAVALFITQSAVAIKADMMAPDFTLKSASGKNLRLNDYRGQVVMVNFWATWCAPCRKELPHLNKLYQKYQDQGFTLLGVNIDSESAEAKRMAKELKIAFPVLFDTKQETSKLYKLKAMPSTVLVDRSGKVISYHLGYKPGYERKYEKEVQALLKK
ncbi:MAG: TlpA family protein disulfide reductase [Pseudomonadota bacterium]|nr:MAG: TlpA family protein disulfide reductase [Pseudomonadota bacterium]